MKIQVHNKDYRVKFLNPFSSELSNGGSYGSTNHSVQEIYIANNLHPDLTKDVITHELTHAYIEAHKQRQESYTEEQVCELFELFAENISIKTKQIINERNNTL